jgi:small subunit ribosomal protein S1
VKSDAEAPAATDPAPEEGSPGDDAQTFTEAAPTAEQLRDPLVADSEPASDIAAMPRSETPDQAAERVAAEMSEDMADLLASGQGMTDLKPGDRVRGTVVGLLDDSVLIDVRGKSEGYIPKRELTGPGGKLSIDVGQEIEAQVVAADAQGIRLSVGAIQALRLSEQLESAAANHMPVKGKVVGYNKGGLEVKLGGRRAFCPASQVDREFSEDLSHHVGQSYGFLITRYDPTGRRIVVSRRAYLELEAKELAAQTRQMIEPGAILAGTVRKVMEFGAFVDMGGIDGLVHVSEISWERVEHPKDVLSEGQQVMVKVLKIDKARDRIGLSMKQATADPWKEAKDKFEVDGSYEGKVTRLTDFGAFVELTPGLEGLVHVSEIDWKRIRHPSDVLTVGDVVTVKLVEMDTKRHRLGLSIKQAGEDPWATGAGQLQVGREIEVTVEKVADFGVFCTINEGMTGLMPNSLSDTPRGANLRRTFKVGSKIKVFIEAIDRRQRKVTLTRKQGNEGGGQDYKAYLKEQKKSQGDSMGALAMALQSALDSGK